MNIGLKFGLILGGSYCAWTLITYVFGLDTTRIDAGHIGDYLVTILPVVLLFLSIRRKKNLAGGTLGYVDALKTGLMVSLIAWVIYTPFLILYHHVINPDWLDYVLEFQKRTMIEANTAAGDIDERIERIRAGSTDIMHAVNGLIFGVIILGSIISSISFALVKMGAKKDQPNAPKGA